MRENRNKKIKENCIADMINKNPNAHLWTKKQQSVFFQFKVKVNF